MKERLLRYSERTDFLKCQQRWWWAWREGLRSPHSSPNALWFGTGVHVALAAWYTPQGRGRRAGFRRGPHPVETWKQYCNGERGRFFSVDSPTTVDETEWVDMVELGVAMLTAYVNTYGKDDAWEFIAPEYRFSYTMPGKPTVRHVGTFDGVFRDHSDDGRLKLAEHKTASQIVTRHLIMDYQASDYWLMANLCLRRAGLLPNGEYIEQIVFNFLRKTLPDARPTNADGHSLNKNGSVSKVQPRPMFHREQVDRTLEEMETHHGHIMTEIKQMDALIKGVANGTAEPTKNPGWQAENCRGCPFVEMCELHEQGGDWEEYRDLVYRVQDPYADHRQGAANSKLIEV